MTKCFVTNNAYVADCSNISGSLNWCMIERVLDFLTISVFVRYPKNEWRLSVRSVLIYEGVYPQPSNSVMFILRSVSSICSKVYSPFSFDSGIRYTRSAAKQIIKYTLIHSYLDTWTGLASKSVLIIRKHSSICYFLLLIATIWQTSPSMSVTTV